MKSGMMRGIKMRGAALLLFALLLWSTGGPLLRECDLGWAGWIFFANVVGQTLLFLRYGPSLFREIRRIPLRLVVLLSGSLALNASTFFMAFEETSITNTLLVHYTAPIWIAAAAPRLLGEPRSKRTPLAILLGTAGIAAILWDHTNGQTAGAVPAAGGRNDRLGILLSLVSSFGYAGLVLSTRAAGRRDFAPQAISAATSIPLTFLVIPFVDFSRVTGPGVAWAALGGLLHIPMAGVLYCAGIASLSAETAGILGYAEVLFGHLWGVFLYGEAATRGVLIGGALIFLGGFLTLSASPGGPPPPRA